MAINPNIPLQVQVGDPLGQGLSRFQDVLGLSNQIRNAPLQRKLLEQQAQQQSLQNQALEQQLQPQQPDPVQVAQSLNKLATGLLGIPAHKRAEELSDEEGQALLLSMGINTANLDLTNEGLNSLITQTGALIQTPQPKPVQPKPGTGVLAGLVFDPQSGSFSVDPVAMELIQQQAATKLAESGGLTLKDITPINKDITNLTKATVDIRAAADTLVSLKASSSPAAKIAATFQFMKSLDPTSTVRDTELGQVYSAEGAAGQIAGLLNNLIGEGKLTSSGFDDLVATSINLANSSIAGTTRTVAGYLDVISDKISPAQLKKLQNRVPKPFDIKQQRPPVKIGDIGPNMSDEDLERILSGG